MRKASVLASLVGVVLAQANTIPSTTPKATTADSQSNASSANLASLPQCAQNCIGSSAGATNDCNQLDILCLCNNHDYTDTLSCCLTATCNVDDRAAAAAFTVQLCLGVNVTLPGQLPGCSRAAVTLSGEGFTTTIKGTGNNESSITTTGAPNSPIQAALTVPTSAPVASFTGDSILNGNCSTVGFASATLGSGGSVEYPWLGCSENNPGCCPFDPKIGGSLSVCPKGYVTTAHACCPSGWSIYTSAFAGQTPCFSSPPLPLIAPTQSSRTVAGPTPSIISTELFTLKYALATNSPASRFPTGAVVGITVGLFLTLALLIMSFTLLFRRRRGRVNSTAKRNKENTITNELDGEALKDPCSPNGTHVTELPTPRSITKFVIPASMLPGIDGGELPAALPVEVPGDVFMNEHHPATIPHIASLGKLSGIDEKIEESEVAPAYTLVSGSILGPLSEETREDGEAKTEASEQPSAIPNSSSPKVSYTLVDSTKMVSPLSPQGDASRTEGAAVLQRRSAPQRRRG